MTDNTIRWDGTNGLYITWAGSNTRPITWAGKITDVPPFPPAKNPVIGKAILSYLYVQYNDDDNLQAFADAYNELAQQYVDFLTSLNLPVYTNPNVSGTLLDWVAEGLYGVERPSLPSDLTTQIAAINTFEINKLKFPINALIPAKAPTTDDVFRRIITWNFSKTDGRYFCIKWLKRRVMQFLYGTDGVNLLIDNTYPVSVTFGSHPVVNITVPSTLQSPILKAAIESRALELPFQYQYHVQVTP